MKDWGNQLQSAAGAPHFPHAHGRMGALSPLAPELSGAYEAGPAGLGRRAAPRPAQFRIPTWPGSWGMAALKHHLFGKGFAGSRNRAHGLLQEAHLYVPTQLLDRLHSLMN